MIAPIQFIVGKVGIALPRWSEIKAQFGEPTHTAYSNYMEGSMTFAFPERGLAFIADEKLDAVFIQNCFVPMSPDNYMLTYGNFLPVEDPFIKCEQAQPNCHAIL